jgi:3-hydroxybutyryl-CoA dehydratase
MQSKHGYYFEDLSVGMSASYTRTITDKDIRQFAEVSGDTNPVHLDEEFAASTRFKKRIAHGMLSGSSISTVVGTKLPLFGPRAG